MKNIIVLLSCFAISLFVFGGCAARKPAPSGTASPVTEATVKSTGLARLTWEAPTTNTDGSPLTNLAGYNVYYGPVSGERAEMKKKRLELEDEELVCKKIDGGKEKARTLCSYTVRGLSPALHYFKVTAFNATGQESDFSNEVKK